MAWTDYRDLVLASNPVFYYSLHQISGTYDTDLVSGLTATLSGSATFVSTTSTFVEYVEDQSGSLYCSGTGRALCQYTNLSNIDVISGSYTVEMWYRLQTSSAGRGNYNILSRMQSFGGGYTILQFYSSSTSHLACWVQWITTGSQTAYVGTNYSVGGTTTGSVLSVQDGRWHHIVFTYSGSALQTPSGAFAPKCYVDGVSWIPTLSSTAWLPVSTYPPSSGAALTSSVIGAGWTLLGSGSTVYAPAGDSLVDVAFYTSTLSYDTIVAHYTSSRLNPEIDLTGTISGSSINVCTYPNMDFVYNVTSSTGGGSAVLVSRLNPGLN